MDTESFYEFWVHLLKDEETGQIVAEVPTLDIADYGPDSQEALQGLKEMVVFHLECLLAEGKPIPEENVAEEGIYLKVRRPVGAP